MDKETRQRRIQALIDSALIYEDKVNNHPGEWYPNGRMDCPLCIMVDSQAEDPGFGCDGCPIYEYTGVIGCRNTPYAETRAHYIYGTGPDHGPSWDAIGFAEISFLNYLLRKEYADSANYDADPVDNPYGDPVRVDTVAILLGDP